MEVTGKFRINNQIELHVNAKYKHFIVNNIIISCKPTLAKRNKSSSLVFRPNKDA